MSGLNRHVEDIIKALKALPQCMKVNTEATNMRAKTPSGVKKSRSKKMCSEKEKPGAEGGRGSKRPLTTVGSLQYRYTNVRASTVAHS